MRQSTVSDCGLACVAMVASAYGCHITLAELRARFPPTLRGLTVRQLAKVAGDIGLEAEAVTFEIKGLRELSLPAVLHWRGSHYVVLTHVGNDSVVLLDPAWGRKHYRIADLRPMLTGVAIEMNPTERLVIGKTGRRQRAFQAILDELKGLRGEIAKLLITALYLESLTIAIPLLLAHFLDTVGSRSGTPAGTTIVCAILAAVVAACALRLFRSLALTYLSATVRGRFLSKLIPRLLEKPFEFFRHRTIADLQHSLAGAEWFRNTVTDELLGVVADGIAEILILAVMVFLEPAVALITFVALGLIAVSVFITARRSSSALDDIIQSRGAESVFVFETLRAAKTIKLFGQERERASVWQRRVHRTITQEVSHSRRIILSNALPALTAELVVVGTMVMLVLLPPSGSVTVGTIVAVYVYQRLGLERCRALAFRAAQMKILQLHMNRLADVMEEPVAGHSPSTGEGGAQVHWSRDGRILEVEGLSFRFDPDAAPILENVSFSLGRGELLAIHGRSGVGKSTLLEILLGIRQPGEGEVRWAGVPLRELDQSAFRRSVVAITQDDVILAGTIEENITLFDPSADHDRMVDAARTAKLEADILAMPLQYASSVGESGCALSGGQRQRLLLARALYARPRVLIIDEGTSEIDPATEREIYAGLKRRGITIVVVAHRRETLRLADRTLLLECGKLSESLVAREAEFFPGIA